MSGHLFITQGDLTELACHAWLVPSDALLHVREHWLKGLPKDTAARLRPGGGVAPRPPAGWGNDGIRVSCGWNSQPSAADHSPGW
jgi:hypothetical protein